MAGYCSCLLVIYVFYIMKSAILWVKFYDLNIKKNDLDIMITREYNEL